VLPAIKAKHDHRAQEFRVMLDYRLTAFIAGDRSLGFIAHGKSAGF